MVTSPCSSGASNCLRSSRIASRGGAFAASGTWRWRANAHRPRMSVPSIVKKRLLVDSMGEGVGAVFGDVAVPVEQILRRDAHLIEHDAAVVDTGQAAPSRSPMW